MRKLKRGQKGFTLIELMIVVAIIGVLSAVAIPRFANLIRRGKEGAAQGNLGALRSAISIYYGDVTIYPDSLEALTTKYIQKIPYSDPTNEKIDAGGSEDPGSWVYSKADGGTLFIGGAGTDTKGNAISSW